MASSRILFVFDFDNTLVQTDSQLHVMQNLASKEQGARFEAEMNSFLAEEGADWQELWLSWMESLWQEHGKALPDAFHGSLLDIPMHEGTVSLLQTVRSKFCDNAKMVILSDANTTEIRSVLRHKGLEEHFHDIVAHESGFREDGKLFAVSRGRDRRHTCEVRDTHLGMCKGIELREYLKSLENEHKPHIVVYCGDGFNDVCGVLGALGESDYVLALRGAALHTSLEQMKAEKPESVKPTVLAWTDGAELEKLALDILRHHTQSD